MLTILFHSMTAILLTMILLTVMTMLNQQTLNNRSKNSPFECGFDPQESARLPFSLRFFLLAIIFLIFDIEIALLFPLIISMKMMNLKITYLSGTIFLIILIGGLIHEWKQGTLSWVK
uniref:NADH-ubiquinone oxidoreductase chain 3 n=1 Tax=Watersipora subtorquata TaxID=193294 RepID=C4MEF8_9BILA|nr:NADH dehydrogenase subunit 3 [Watersipora subtorquata]ABY55226.1 NADH dehydrogenase subunit 3 [Watersipora subtorquata]